MRNAQECMDFKQNKTSLMMGTWSYGYCSLSFCMEIMFGELSNSTASLLKEHVCSTYLLKLYINQVTVERENNDHVNYMTTKSCVLWKMSTL